MITRMLSKKRIHPKEYIKNEVKKYSKILKEKRIIKYIDVYSKRNILNRFKRGELENEFVKKYYSKFRLRFIIVALVAFLVWDLFFISDALSYSVAEYKILYYITFGVRTSAILFQIPYVIFWCVPYLRKKNFLLDAFTMLLVIVHWTLLIIIQNFRTTRNVYPSSQQIPLALAFAFGLRSYNYLGLLIIPLLVFIVTFLPFDTSLMVVSWLGLITFDFVKTLVYVFGSENIFRRSFLKERKLEAFRKITEHHRAKKESILRSVLPDYYVSKIQKYPLRRYLEMRQGLNCVLTDLEEFTKFCSSCDQKKLINLLNTMYTEFDMVAEEFGIMKIKTIGDAHMSVDFHLSGDVTCVRYALKLQEVLITKLNPKFGMEFKMRVGLAKGMGCIGYIGMKSLCLDVFGPVVAKTKQLESSCCIGEIQICDIIAENVKHAFTLIENRRFKGGFFVRELDGKKSCFWEFSDDNDDFSDDSSQDSYSSEDERLEKKNQIDKELHEYRDSMYILQWRRHPAGIIFQNTGFFHYKNTASLRSEGESSASSNSYDDVLKMHATFDNNETGSESDDDCHLDYDGEGHHSSNGNSSNSTVNSENSSVSTVNSDFLDNDVNKKKSYFQKMEDSFSKSKEKLIRSKKIQANEKKMKNKYIARKWRINYLILRFSGFRQNLDFLKWKYEDQIVSRVANDAFTFVFYIGLLLSWFINATAYVSDLKYLLYQPGMIVNYCVIPLHLICTLLFVIFRKFMPLGVMISFFNSFVFPNICIFSYLFFIDCQRNGRYNYFVESYQIQNFLPFWSIYLQMSNLFFDLNLKLVITILSTLSFVILNFVFNMKSFNVGTILYPLFLLVFYYLVNYYLHISITLQYRNKQKIQREFERIQNETELTKRILSYFLPTFVIKKLEKAEKKREQELKRLGKKAKRRKKKKEEEESDSDEALSISTIVSFRVNEFLRSDEVFDQILDGCALFVEVVNFNLNCEVDRILEKMSFLNDLYSSFDEILLDYTRCVKIKSINTSYLLFSTNQEIGHSKIKKRYLKKRRRRIRGKRRRRKKKKKRNSLINEDLKNTSSFFKRVTKTPAILKDKSTVLRELELEKKKIRRSSFGSTAHSDRMRKGSELVSKVSGRNVKHKMEICYVALDFKDLFTEMCQHYQIVVEEGMGIQIGISQGQFFAGLVGSIKGNCYDIFGNTINVSLHVLLMKANFFMKKIASRMSMNCQVGDIQVSKLFVERDISLLRQFQFKKVDGVFVKGRGRVSTYLLEKEKDDKIFYKNLPKEMKEEIRKKGGKKVIKMRIMDEEEILRKKRTLYEIEVECNDDGNSYDDCKFDVEGFDSMTDGSISPGVDHQKVKVKKFLRRVRSDNDRIEISKSVDQGNSIKVIKKTGNEQVIEINSPRTTLMKGRGRPPKLKINRRGRKGRRKRKDSKKNDSARELKFSTSLKEMIDNQ